MKKIFFSALLLGAALSLSAQSKYDHYYTDLPIEIERVQEVKFPATSVNIAQYGAVPDGKTDCTEAFNKAIKELSKQGGGHVIVPRGVWKTGPIQLRSNIDLHLSKGATIQPARRQQEMLRTHSRVQMREHRYYRQGCDRRSGLHLASYQREESRS